MTPCQQINDKNASAQNAWNLEVYFRKGKHCSKVKKPLQKSLTAVSDDTAPNNQVMDSVSDSQ